MTRITITEENMRNPTDSVDQNIRLEFTPACEGEYCSMSPVSEPHKHVVVSGENPKTSPRYFRV